MGDAAGERAAGRAARQWHDGDRLPLYRLTHGRAAKRAHPFEGIIPNLERRYRETESSTVREELGK